MTANAHARIPNNRPSVCLPWCDTFYTPWIPQRNFSYLWNKFSIKIEKKKTTCHSPSMKNIFYICTCHRKVADIFDESVSFYPWTEIWKIYEYRDISGFHHLVLFDRAFCTITIRVWGCLFVFRSSRTSVQINARLHTFVLYAPAKRKMQRQKN